MQVRRILQSKCIMQSTALRILKNHFLFTLIICTNFESHVVFSTANKCRIINFSTRALRLLELRHFFSRCMKILIRSSNLAVKCPAFIGLQCHRKWLGDIRDIRDTVSPLGILWLILDSSFDTYIPIFVSLRLANSSINSDK